MKSNFNCELRVSFFNKQSSFNALSSLAWIKERQWKYLGVLLAPTISSMRVNFAFKHGTAKRLSEKIRKVRNVFIDSLKCISKFSAARRNVGHCDILNPIQWRTCRCKYIYSISLYIWKTFHIFTLYAREYVKRSPKFMICVYSWKEK